MSARDELKAGFAPVYAAKQRARFEQLLDQVEAEALAAAVTALTAAANREQPDVPGVAGLRAGLRAGARIVQRLHDTEAGAS